MNDLIMLGIVVVVILLGVIFIPKLMSKFHIEPADIRTYKSYLEIADNILEALDLDENITNKGNLVLDIANKVVDAIQELAYPNADKNAISHKILDEVLSQLGIKPTQKQRQLIDTVISYGLEWWANKK